MRIDRNSPEVLAQILSPEFQARFWSHVDRKGPDECWLWTANVGRGYGLMQLTFMKFKMCFSAHRISWIILHKTFPPSEKPMVLHSCIAAPTCCNPNHLRAGTAKENMADKMAQGRGNFAVGNRAFGCKLSESDVIEIRSLLARGHMQKTIALMFGVHRQQISKIHLRLRWKHI